jgi:hypothetical protein
VGALWLAASTGCQLLMEDIRSPDSKESGVDAGAHNDADVDASTIVPSDAAGMDAPDDAAQLDAQQEPDGEPADADDPDTDAPPLDAAPVDTGTPEPDPEACDGAGETIYYRDYDKDGYGDPAKRRNACEVPTGYVSEAGDCNDENDEVHPGQTQFFGDGYPVAGSSDFSFDYNCSTGEDPGPGQIVAQECTDLLCTGSGYLPNAARANVVDGNQYCGSRQKSTCGFLALLGCQPTIAAVQAPYVCN